MQTFSIDGGYYPKPFKSLSLIRYNEHSFVEGYLDQDRKTVILSNGKREGLINFKSFRYNNESIKV